MGESVMMHIVLIPGKLHFKRPAGTSRGVYTERKVWYVKVTSDRFPGRTGIGECAPLPQLSCDDLPDYEERARALCRQTALKEAVDVDILRDFPSLLFGLEGAFRQLETGSTVLWDTPFSRGEAGIPINGLIWMGDYDYMYRQIVQKLELGFRCVKLKIGAIDFERELELLRFIRSRFPADTVELRVDANGAFSPHDALEKLKYLSDFELHSIEQPIRAGQWQELARLVEDSPLPIALDEELIGYNKPEDKQRLLDVIRPDYIVLKPSLHGGISGCGEWIDLAKSAGIGWWITSALESNVGLNVIAQWCATLKPELPQGLGTGALFTDNVPMPLEVKGDCLWYLPGKEQK